MITEEQIEKAIALKNTVQVWRNDFASPEYNFISELNYIVSGMPLNRMRNCDCVIDFFNIILPLYLKKQKNMSEFFKLKESVPSFETMKYGTISSLTSDEVHAELIKEFPNLEKHYASCRLEDFEKSKQEPDPEQAPEVTKAPAATKKTPSEKANKKDPKVAKEPTKSEATVKEAKDKAPEPEQSPAPEAPEAPEAQEGEKEIEDEDPFADDFLEL